MVQINTACHHICFYRLCHLKLWGRQFFLSRCTRQSPAESDDTRDCIYTVTT